MAHDDDNPNFLDATDLEPDYDGTEELVPDLTWGEPDPDPDDTPECEGCGEGSDDLHVVSSHRTDPETGARDDDRMLCQKCRGRNQ